jgi:hypothetical protein
MANFVGWKPCDASAADVLTKPSLTIHRDLLAALDEAERGRLMDAANVTLIRKDNTAALRQRRSRAKQAANSVTGKSEQKQEYFVALS